MKWWVLIVAVACGTTSAGAHEIHLWAESDGHGIDGYVYEGDRRITGATVKISNEHGTVLTQVKTDERGEFEFHLHETGLYTVSAETDQGHAIKKTVEMTAADHGDEPITLAMLDAKLSGVSQQIEELKTRRTRQDILGAAGYLIGAAGIGYYMMGRRANIKSNRP